MHHIHAKLHVLLFLFFDFEVHLQEILNNSQDLAKEEGEPAKKELKMYKN